MTVTFLHCCFIQSKSHSSPVEHRVAAAEILQILVAGLSLVVNIDKCLRIQKFSSEDFVWLKFLAGAVLYAKSLF